MSAYPSRRGFLAGLASLVASPAIVRVTSLMPVSAYPTFDDYLRHPSLDIDAIIRLLGEQNDIFDALNQHVSVPYPVWLQLNAGVPYNTASSIAFPPGDQGSVRLGQYLTRLPQDVSTPLPVHYDRTLGFEG